MPYVGVLKGVSAYPRGYTAGLLPGGVEERTPEKVGRRPNEPIVPGRLEQTCLVIHLPPVTVPGRKYAPVKDARRASRRVYYCARSVSYDGEVLEFKSITGMQRAK
jgi:hypothetical protein